jgi:LmbE family N-acetylglucosaminyl deacetylase
MKLFIAPHCDDEVLFGSFTLLRERPFVFVVYDSVIQGARGAPITAEQRRAETILGVNTLLAGEAHFLQFGGVPDDGDHWAKVHHVLAELAQKLAPIEEVFAPAIESGGHAQHNLVGQIAAEVWPGKVRHYLTYTTAGKSKGPVSVACDLPWIALKHKALACYESQFLNPSTGTASHFLADLYEYYADAK